jgi:hypothetical protein
LFSLTVFDSALRFDPSEFVIEHYCDGDVVNSQTPVANEQAGPHLLSVWGPPVPEGF